MKPQKRVYGRRAGRPLNTSRVSALDTLLPQLAIPAELLNEKAETRIESLFNTPAASYWFEIGFGNGEHLAALMARNPDTGYLGAEPFINGMSAFLKSIHDVPHDHVRILMDDAMMIANSLEDRCLDGIYVLNPDPWHKKRHHKRRIINQKNLDQFARILKPGGQLIMSTDVPDLAEWMVTEAVQHPAFDWTAQKADDWRTPPPGWIKTRYEEKGARGADKMVYLIFEKA
ncbi:MAG: tRNA (guanosine(46)-N7)-methyltransferase TrmB [Rhodospirillales bacterium]|nr:tRNA (guanosine(46)-N7)-methyltransferase TrmB [Rhodospirillales bacterium]MCB9995788.1 tRNA (guanosine(46)-N7)-methyltransferase TrmB [Rhodospirillales bacterium]